MRQTDKTKTLKQKWRQRGDGGRDGDGVLTFRPEQSIAQFQSLDRPKQSKVLHTEF